MPTELKNSNHLIRHVVSETDNQCSIGLDIYRQFLQINLDIMPAKVQFLHHGGLRRDSSDPVQSFSENPSWLVQKILEPLSGGLDLHLVPNELSNSVKTEKVNWMRFPCKLLASSSTFFIIIPTQSIPQFKICLNLNSLSVFEWSCIC